MKVKKLVVFLVCVTAFQAALVPAKADTPPIEMRLAENGRTDYVIALADDAIPAEQTAAQELSDYLGQITGATFPVKAEKDVAPDAGQILVGAGSRVRCENVALSAEKRRFRTKRGAASQCGNDPLVRLHQALTGPIVVSRTEVYTHAGTRQTRGSSLLLRVVSKRSHRSFDES